MRSAYALFLIAFTVACLTALNVSEAKKPSNPGNDDGEVGVDYQFLALDTSGYDRGTAWDISNRNPLTDETTVVGAVYNLDSLPLAACWTIQGTNVTPHLLQAGNVATAVNAFGEIVGTVSVNNIDHGLYWANESSAPVAIPPSPGTISSVPLDINRDGVICGATADGAAVWQVGAINGETVIHGPFALGNLFANGDEAEWSIAVAINNFSQGTCQVVGSSSNGAVQWRLNQHSDGSISVSSGPEAIGFGTPSAGNGVNDAGLVCGESGDDAVVSLSGVMDILPQPANAVNSFSAADLNLHGDVAGDGTVSVRRGKTEDHAFLWVLQEGDWSIVDLDGFLPKSLRGSSWAQAINDSSDVVGDARRQPCIWVRQ